MSTGFLRHHIRGWQCKRERGRARERAREGGAREGEREREREESGAAPSTAAHTAPRRPARAAAPLRRQTMPHRRGGTRSRRAGMVTAPPLGPPHGRPFKNFRRLSPLHPLKKPVGLVVCTSPGCLLSVASWGVFWGHGKLGAGKKKVPPEPSVDVENLGDVCTEFVAALPGAETTPK